jgi:hypothetical protein
MFHWIKNLFKKKTELEKWEEFCISLGKDAKNSTLSLSDMLILDRLMKGYKYKIENGQIIWDLNEK